MHYINKIFRIPKLQKKILFTLGALATYWIGSVIPIPGINPEIIKTLFGAHSNAWGRDVFSAGPFEKFSIFSLGIMPYMNAAAIIYFLHIAGVVRSPKEFTPSEKESLSLYNWTLLLTLLLALIQSYGLATAISRMSVHGYSTVLNAPTRTFCLIAVPTMTAGSLFIVWLTHQMTKNGIGNGISLIILFGMARYISSAATGFISNWSHGQTNYPELLLLGILAAIVLAVYMEQARIKIPIQFIRSEAKEQAAAPASFPLNISQSGVVAMDWAVSALTIPLILVQLSPPAEWSNKVLEYWGRGSWIYDAAYACLIIFLCYLFAAIIINPKTLAKRLREYGGTIPGVAPDAPTQRYLELVLERTLPAGALYVVAIAIFPDILRWMFETPFFLGGTALLLTIGISLDVINDVDAHIAMEGHEGKTIFTGINHAEADLAKCLLEANGIQAFVLDGNICRLNPLAVLAIKGIRVQVPQAQMEKARKILQKISDSRRKIQDDDDAPLKTQRRCPACGVPRELDASFCDQCSHKF